MTKRDFLQLSGVVVDLVHRVPRLPESGEEVESPEVLISTGGGFNAMAAAARLGASTCYGGPLGTGRFADLARQDLASADVAILNQSRPQFDQGTCVVLVEPSGERSFISCHGAERHYEWDWDKDIDASGFRWLLLSGYPLFKTESARMLVPWIDKMPRGPSLLFDPGPTVAGIPRSALDSVLKRADWLSANRREAAVLSGCDDPRAACAALAKGRAGAIVRIGAEGCWLAVSENEPRHVPGFAVEAVDTNGAGDTHCGTFVAAMSFGHAAADAADIANAASALSSTKMGPATGPTREELNAFLSRRGVALTVIPEKRLAS